MNRFALMFALSALLFAPSGILAQDSPQEARHKLMEGVGDAAKPVGGMLKGELAFDAAVAMESFRAWSEAAALAGDLFPEGSESGYKTRAKATIWSDREGFDAALRAFAESVDAAIAAEPQDLAALQSAAGPVFKACKNCHEGYRLEEEG